MTNEQTHLFMKQFCARLREAVGEAERLMPSDAARETLRRHVEPKCIGMFCRDETHFQEEAGESLALAPVRTLLDEWERDAALLAVDVKTVRT